YVLFVYTGTRPFETIEDGHGIAVADWGPREQPVNSGASDAPRSNELRQHQGCVQRPDRSASHSCAVLLISGAGLPGVHPPAAKLLSTFHRTHARAHVRNAAHPDRICDRSPDYHDPWISPVPAPRRSDPPVRLLPLDVGIGDLVALTVAQRQ